MLYCNRVLCTVQERSQLLQDVAAPFHGNARHGCPLPSASTQTISGHFVDANSLKSEASPKNCKHCATIWQYNTVQTAKLGERTITARSRLIS